MAKKKEKMSLEELLEQAIVKEEDRPYEVPRNWVWIKFEYIIQDVKLGLVRGSKEQSNEYTYNYLKMNNISSNGNLDFSNLVNVEATDIDVENFLLKSGDFLFNTRNSRELVGKNTVVKNDFTKPMLFNNNIMRIRFTKIINPQIVSYYLNSPLGQLKLDEIKKVTTNVAAIYAKDLNSIAIPIPSLEEQQRIVDIIQQQFEKLDTAKELVQNALDSFENRKAAIFHKAFTGELTGKWREENEVSFDEWEEKKLAETDIQIIDGDRGNNYPRKEEFSDNGYCLFLNAKNVTRNGFAFDELNFITKEKDELLRKGKLKRFDIILTTRGTIGNIAYFDESIPYENMRINSGMVIYRGGSDFYKPFLCWLYKSNYIKNQIANIKTGSAQPQLPIKIMKDLKLIIPSLLEQKEIVRILDNLLDNEQRAKELCDVIEKIDLMKKAILSRAFRGELGTNDPEDESAVELLKYILKEQDK